MSVYFETRCPKCKMSEMKLVENAVPGMNCEGEERQYDIWYCLSCSYKFVIGKKNVIASPTT
jgi:hypothetical protein